jgi:hypothetical protein
MIKKNLLKLTDEKLFAIGRDFSFTGSRIQVASSLATYFRTYGFKWSDIQSRYQIEIK